MEVYNDKSFSVSSRFFNIWDWDNSKPSVIEDYTSNAYGDILFEMGREEQLQ